MDFTPPPTRYLMIINGERHWLPKRQAARAWDSGTAQVEWGGKALDPGESKEREMTREETLEIQELADEISASK